MGVNRRATPSRKRMASGRASNTFADISPAEQQRFDQLYNRFALKQAQDLRQVGLNGVPVFEAAQRSIAGGAQRCTATNPGEMK